MIEVNYVGRTLGLHFLVKAHYRVVECLAKQILGIFKTCHVFRNAFSDFGPGYVLCKVETGVTVEGTALAIPVVVGGRSSIVIIVTRVLTLVTVATTTAASATSIGFVIVRKFNI